MHKNLYPVPESFASAAQVKHVDYERMYAESLEDPDRFWGRIGRRIDWIQGALTITGTDCVKHVLVVRRTGTPVPMYAHRDHWYDGR
jgi:acetyl-CoA synthetase